MVVRAFVNMQSLQGSPPAVDWDCSAACNPKSQLAAIHNLSCIFSSFQPFPIASIWLRHKSTAGGQPTCMLDKALQCMNLFRINTSDIDQKWPTRPGEHLSVSYEALSQDQPSQDIDNWLSWPLGMDWMEGWREYAAVWHEIEVESSNRGKASHLVQSQNARDYLTSYPPQQYNPATIQAAARHTLQSTTVSVSFVETFSRSSKGHFWLKTDFDYGMTWVWIKTKVKKVLINLKRPNSVFLQARGECETVVSIAPKFLP